MSSQINKTAKLLFRTSGGSRIFPWGGAPSLWAGRQPLTWMLFGKSICENERIGSHWGHAPAAPPPLDPPMRTLCFRVWRIFIECLPLEHLNDHRRTQGRHLTGPSSFIFAYVFTEKDRTPFPTMGNPGSYFLDSLL